jgi:hypothetical protein
MVDMLEFMVMLLASLSSAGLELQLWSELWSGTTHSSPSFDRWRQDSPVAIFLFFSFFLLFVRLLKADTLVTDMGTARAHASSRLSRLGVEDTDMPAKESPLSMALFKSTFEDLSSGEVDDLAVVWVNVEGEALITELLPEPGGSKRELCGLSSARRLAFMYTLFMEEATFTLPRVLLCRVLELIEAVTISSSN